jgi:hypothetical protein
MEAAYWSNQIMGPDALREKEGERQRERDKERERESLKVNKNQVMSEAKGVYFSVKKK